MALKEPPPYVKGHNLLEGKSVLITAAAGAGIGFAAATRAAEEGARAVMISDIHEGRLEKAVATLKEATGLEAIYGKLANVTLEEDVQSLIDEAESTMGGVDVLINNAGLGHKASLLDGNSEQWREMLEVNVLALCICTREAIQDMRRRGDDGHVIHIGSMAGHRVPVGSGVYSATKFAVRSLTEGLRQELRAANSQIRVTAISPGFVETEFAGLYHASQEAARQTYGRFKVLQSEDLAEAVAFVLASPAHMQVHDILLRPTNQQS